MSNSPDCTILHSFVPVGFNVVTGAIGSLRAFVVASQRSAMVTAGLRPKDESSRSLRERTLRRTECAGYDSPFPLLFPPQDERRTYRCKELL